MGKFYGSIGYAESVEIRPGVHEEQITERKYYGDVNRDSRRLQSANQLNDNINVSSEISIVADPYAYNHFHSMRYAEFMGAKWKILTVEPKPPRLILTLGGLYNGE